MKTYRRATVSIAAVLIASCATNIWAQPTSRGSSSGMYVALLDLGYIFKNHPRFKQKMDIMKKDVQTFEQEIKKKQQQLEAAGRRLSSYKPGTPEYKQIEETTTKQLADVKVRMQLKRKEIMEREAQIYMETYKDVVNAVASFARRKKIDLVLRYDSDTSAAAGAADPRETLKIINRPVIFQQQLDISSAILGEITRSTTARTSGKSPR